MGRERKDEREWGKAERTKGRGEEKKGVEMIRGKSKGEKGVY